MSDLFKPMLACEADLTKLRFPAHGTKKRVIDIKLERTQ